MEARYIVEYYNPLIHTKGEVMENRTAEEVMHFFTAIPWQEELKKMAETELREGLPGPIISVVNQHNEYTYTALCLPHMPNGWDIGYSGLYFKRFLGFKIARLDNHMSSVNMKSLQDVINGLALFVHEDYEKLDRFTTNRHSRPTAVSKLDAQANKDATSLT